jgi:hypothetical protein
MRPKPRQLTNKGKRKEKGKLTNRRPVGKMRWGSQRGGGWGDSEATDNVGMHARACPDSIWATAAEIGLISLMISISYHKLGFVLSYRILAVSIAPKLATSSPQSTTNMTRAPPRSRDRGSSSVTESSAELRRLSCVYAAPRSGGQRGRTQARSLDHAVWRRTGTAEVYVLLTRFVGEQKDFRE